MLEGAEAVEKFSETKGVIHVALRRPETMKRNTDIID